MTGILTTPFDVLKTRLMTQGTSGSYKNVGDCAVKIWQQEGWKTFFKVVPLFSLLLPLLRHDLLHLLQQGTMPIVGIAEVCRVLMCMADMPMVSISQGWEPRVLWISIGGCVFFSALEASKTFYHKSLGLPPPKIMH